MGVLGWKLMRFLFHYLLHLGDKLLSLNFSLLNFLIVFFELFVLFRKFSMDLGQLDRLLEQFLLFLIDIYYI